MGKGSPINTPEKVKLAARQMRQKTLPSSPLPVTMATPTSTTAATVNATTAITTQNVPLRRYTTLTRPEVHSGRVVEYSELSRSTRTLKDADRSPRPKPWVSNAVSAKTPTSNRKNLIGNINLRRTRRTSRSSSKQAESSSCKQSDSTANGSQKSALTTESLEAIPASGDDREGEGKVKLTEEELERQRNIEKCMRWIDQLPAKFSGMHIVQERAPVMFD